MDTNVTLPVGPRKWYEIWLDVWTHPGVATFRSMLNDPMASSKRGFIWIAVTGLIAGLLGGLISALMIKNSEFPVSTLMCSIVFYPIGAVIGTAISAGIYHLIAKLFKGNGNWSQLVYCFAAVQAPLFLFSAVIQGFVTPMVSLGGQTGNPFFLCLSLLSIPIGIYTIVLYVNSIDAVENIGTGKSIATALAPAVVILILFVCLVGGLAPMLRQ